MIKAVFRDGVIYPLEPVPPEWSNGCELAIHGVNTDQSTSNDDIDRWYVEMNKLASQVEERDILELETALAEADAEAKAHVRREMRLPQ